jgi:hypothetical protein
LAPGELPGLLLDDPDCFGERPQALEVLDDRPIPDGLQGDPILGKALGKKPLGLGDPPLVDHSLHPPVDALTQVGWIPAQDNKTGQRITRPLLPHCAMVQGRTAGQADLFHGANHTPRITAIDAHQ